MDTSEKYIKMCRAADEIQKMWNPEIGDFFVPLHDHNTGYVLHDFADIDDGMQTPYSSLSTWLPRQDQLQDMIGKNLPFIAEGFYEYMESFMPELEDSMYNKYDSMEQLWLAFVMGEKYEKLWDGAEWIDPDAPEEPLLPRIPQMILNFESGTMQAKYITMNQKTLHRISSERGESSLPPMYVPRICGLIPGIDDSLADDVMEIGGSQIESLLFHELLRQFTEDAKAFAALPKTVWRAKPSKPIASQIVAMRDSCLMTGCIRRPSLLIHPKTWDKLALELACVNIPPCCQLDREMKIYGLKVVITDTISETDFMVVGVPL
jgi:hypothetical protein